MISLGSHADPPSSYSPAVSYPKQGVTYITQYVQLEGARTREHIKRDHCVGISDGFLKFVRGLSGGWDDWLATRNGSGCAATALHARPSTRPDKSFQRDKVMTGAPPDRRPTRGCFIDYHSKQDELPRIVSVVCKLLLHASVARGKEHLLCGVHSEV